MSGADAIAAAREQVAAAARRLGIEGLVAGGAGNVSLRVGEARAITAGGADLGAARAEDVALVSPSGGPEPGERRPSSETPLHLAVGAPAIVHTHSHFSTVLSCFGDDVPAIHYLVARFGGPIRVAPYATFGTPELAAAVSEGLSDRTAVLLANHGAVTVGATLDEAVDLAVLLESTCALAYHARLLGGPRELSAVELDEVAAAAIRHGDRE